MSDRIETAKEVNRILRYQRSAIDNTIPQMIEESVILANGDASKGRQVVATIGTSIEFLTVRDWKVNMTTHPGEIVWNPAKTFAFVYTGVTTMTHANSTFYPGASGVYYWSIIPEILDEVKVYPNISGIVVAVKKDEIWWNQAKNQKFKWKGVDNANCSWPPTVGNEWEKV